MASKRDEKHFGKFFIDWPIWARLTLILGGVFVSVLCIAFLIKFILWLKDRKLHKTATTEQVERGEMALAGRLSEEVPFGINALVEDTEVDGVWNSKASTPFHGKRQKTHSSSTVRPNFSIKKSKKNSSVSSASTVGTTDTGVASPEVLAPLTHHSRDVATRIERISLIMDGNTPNVDGEEFSLDVEVGETFSASNNPEMDDQINRSRSKLQLRPLANRPSTKKFMIGTKSRAIPHSRTYAQSDEVDSLERMEAHRRFHAAESGQLFPRGRRHTDIVLTTPLAPSNSDSDDSDSSSSRALSWPIRTVEMNLGTHLSRRAQRIEGPRPVPFRAFVESLPTTKAPPSAWTKKTQAMMDSKISPSSRGSDTTSSTPKHTPTSSTSSTTSTAPTPPPESISISSTRALKVNSGFELLPAGSLQKGPVVKEFGLWPITSLSSKKQGKLRKRTLSNSGHYNDPRDSLRSSNESYRMPIF